MSYKLENLRGKTALITGGLGLIGSNIAQKLVELGCGVTIYDACLDPYGWNRANIEEIKDKVEVIKADTRDLPALESAMAGKDYVFDCAAQVSHTISVKDPLLDLDINARGALNVCEAARKVGEDVKLVYASTRGVFGRAEYLPVDEKHPTNPADTNGIHKLAAEKYYLQYHRIHGIDSTVIRLANTFGPRAQMKHGDYGIVNWFMRKTMLGEQITIHGEGRQTRDFLYVGDAVDALVLAAQEKRSTGEAFNLGSGSQTPFIDMVKLIIEAAESSMTVEKMPRPKERQDIEIGNFVFDISKIKKALGWAPKTGIKDGLRKTFEFYSIREGEYF